MFSIVLTKEGSSHLISVVPSTWVLGNNKDTILFWPRTRKNSDLELLRRDENSVPSENWRKLKCVVKLQGIATFAEGIKLEELYSNFEDTEDEERYHKNRENKRKHPAEKSIVEDLQNYNIDFEMMDNKETKKDNDNVTMNDMNKTTMNEYNSNIYFNHASTSYNTIDDTVAIETGASKIIATNENLTTIPETESQTGETLISLRLIEFNQIITENSGLQAENKILKESNLKFQNLKEETDRGFKALQVQLDKLYDILKHKQSYIDTISTAGTSVSTNFDEEIAQRNIQFPINSIKNLELLEDQLIDTNFEKVLVKKFSRICGTSGMLKISKIGLQLTRCLFTDELLNQLTWKGIKGCTKVPFMNFIKTRNLFFKIIHLADKCCSAKDSDVFLQNSAIKHSGQRMKRNSSAMKIINPKKNKIEIEKKTSTENEDPSSNNLETIIINTPDKEIHEEEANELLRDGFRGLDDKENKIDDTPDTKNRSIKAPKTVTVLSDVKISNKTTDSKHETKMMNVSSYDLRQVFEQNEECNKITNSD
ncbi:unnamed protein product [Spodoptera littoralis]|uniref:DUF4806 domain-containing protein n=3 Tax=Spodoptera littoralis TaxID=7109 RepID=A0A9P0IAT5_SPOLI|nr:unnamed protein product [Spodoptera littoralis]CAH1641894.1 unnamed protein product [Spodoptera littoralis]